jgi:hypothetical protein
MNQPDIELSDAESVLLAQIDFNWDTRRHDHEGFARNSENVAQLILALLEREGFELSVCSAGSQDRTSL